MSSQSEEEKEQEQEPLEQEIGEQEQPPKKTKQINLQLSDVIRIEAPSNQVLNNNTFIIDYIDKNQIKLINVNDLTSNKIKINENGTLGDGSITSIALIDRNETLGYARQNGLLPNTWVNIYFGGDTPVVITGEITNLEEDMIEIKTYPDNDVLYINFGYKGIPLDLPIETIEIREKPETITIKEKAVQQQRESDESIGSIESFPDSTEEDKREHREDVYNLPTRDIKDIVHEFIVRADEIKIGEDLGTISQMVDVEESKQRFNIHSQVDDLLNELLSSIPNVQRTGAVLNNIHTMIERFKQLRTEFSTTDEHGNIQGPLTKSVLWKPLVQNLMTFKTVLYWILPVAKNVKKVYNISTKEDTNDNTDIIPLTIDEDIAEMKTIFDRYKSNEVPTDQNKYFSLISELNPYLTPFQQTNVETNYDVLNDVVILNDVNAIIDNLGDFYSSIAENDIIKTKKYVIQRYNLGTRGLDATQITGTKMIAHQVNITQPDVLELKSIITLPESVIRFSHITLPETNILEKANLNTTFINYWELFTKSASVNKITIDDLEADFEFSENNFVNNIKN